MENLMVMWTLMFWIFSARNAASFFSAQMGDDQMVLYQDNINFDQVIVNYGNDYSTAGSVYRWGKSSIYVHSLWRSSVGGGG